MTTKLETEANDGKGDDQVKLLVETLDGRANGVFANEFECRKYVVRVIDCEEFTLEVASSEWDKALFDLVDKSFVSNRLFAEAGRPDIRSTLQLPLFSVLQRKVTRENAARRL
uniref:DUF4325 domain-containing protein n=1 Tax=Steinernema glaseri TaxID=37863 RepID=A0A1I7Y9F3_9BILA